jgi:hypothetical protein
VADPVSWLLIEAGWKVLAADGSDVGKVDEVTGDSNADIFDGLAIATGAHGKPRYVPSEQVTEITQGTIRLKLSPEEVERLGEFEEPPESARIEPGERDDSLWRRIRAVFKRPTS